MTGPVFFAAPSEFRAWLEANHEDADELLVGFHRRATGRPSLTWPESVDEALCFGWIDGVRRRADAERYTIRFTPRRRRSTWSAVNVGRVEALLREGRMHPSGLRAFEARSPARTGIYAHEQPRDASLPPEVEDGLRARAEAWAFFQAQPPGYRRRAAWYVVSARRPETRIRRLQALVDRSAAGERLV